MKKIGHHSGLFALLACMGAQCVSGLGSHGMLMWDEAHYAVLGRALARGEGYVRPSGAPEALRPPTLPAAVAVALVASPDASDRTVLSVTVAKFEDANGSLADFLSEIDYVVATSFERGQHAYVAGEVRRAEQNDLDRVQTFRDPRYWTKVISAEVLRPSEPHGTGSLP